MERQGIGQAVSRGGIARIISTCMMIFAGCSRPNPSTQPANWDSPDITWLEKIEAPSSKILRGFDEPKKIDDWQIGTEVLYSMYLEGRGEPQTRLVHFKLHSQPLKGIKAVRINPRSPAANPKEVLDIRDPEEESYDLPATDWPYYIESSSTITSDAIVVWLGLYDETSTRLKGHYHLLPEKHLRTGLARYCESITRAVTPSTTPASRPAEQISFPLECHAALQSFGKVVSVSSVAEPLIKRILSRSTLLGMWLFGKPKFAFDLGQPSPETRPLPALAMGRPAWLLPIDISMDGRATLRCRATVTAPDGPLRLCAGVLAFDGFRIDDPSHHFRMVLIAAHLPDAPP